MSKWPRDNQSALIDFYGDPAKHEPERALVPVLPPFRMTYEGKPIRWIQFHDKAAPALKRALDKIWSYYNRDQATIDKFRISHYAGAHVRRMIRGSKTKWSNHAYGAAIDLDAEHNGFGAGRGTMPLPVVAAFKSEGARWGGDYRGRTDPMHFEFCDSGEPARSFDEWLDHYGCPRAWIIAPQKFADIGEVEDFSAKKRPGLFRRIGNWTAGFSGLGFIAYLTDWQIAAIVFGFAFIVLVCATCFFLWLFGKQRVRDWFSRNLA